MHFCQIIFFFKTCIHSCLVGARYLDLVFRKWWLYCLLFLWTTFLDCHGKCTYNNAVNVLPISHVESVLTKLQCFAQECYWLSP